MGDYQTMVTALRDAGIAAELYLGTTRNLGKQLKYADKRNAPAVVIQGGDEKARGVVQIKDLALGKRLAEGITDNEEWREERPGQFEAPEASWCRDRRRLGADPMTDAYPSRSGTTSCVSRSGISPAGGRGPRPLPRRAAHARLHPCGAGRTTGLRSNRLAIREGVAAARRPRSAA